MQEVTDLTSPPDMGRVVRQSFWPFSSSPSRLLLFTGGALVVGGIFYLLGSRLKIRVAKNRKSMKAIDSLMESRLLSDQDAKIYRELLRKLSSGSSDARKEALDTLYDLTKYSHELENIRKVGGLDAVLKIFAEHSTDEGIVSRLTRVIANLATNETARIIIGSSPALEDMFYYLNNGYNEEIREDILRGLMNLSIAAINEDTIREKGGLECMAAIFLNPNSSDKILFQTARVFVNLCVNKVNRKEMIEKHHVEDRVLELLHESNNKELNLRLIRILGTFSNDCQFATFEKLASDDVILMLIKFLKEEAELGGNLPGHTPSEDNDTSKGQYSALCEIILFALGKILTNKTGAEIIPIIDHIKDFIASDTTHGITGIDVILSFLSSDEPGIMIGACTTLSILISSAKVRKTIRDNSKAWEALHSLVSDDSPAAARQEAAKIINACTELD